MQPSGGSSRRLTPQPFPLLQLPTAAQQAVIRHLSSSDARTVRLACHATSRLVDECVTSLTFCDKALRAAPCGLAARFPAVRTLRVEGRIAAAAGETLQIVSRLTQGSIWRSITTVHTRSLPPEAVVLLVAGCPNVQHLHCTVMRDTQPPSTTQLLRVACAVLPLRTLNIGFMGLNSEDFMSIASCSTLVSLQAYLGEVNAASWAALLGMRGLTSLHLHADGRRELPSYVPAGVVLDFSAMPGLQELRLSTSSVVPTPDTAAAVVAPYAAMRLPPSLTVLALQGWPQPRFRLPQLRKFLLAKATVTDADLARLAACCSTLAKLDLANITLTAASHASPLAAVTCLKADRAVVLGEGLRLARTFPNLRKLRLITGSYDIKGMDTLFRGASSLQQVDVGLCRECVWSVSGVTLTHSAFVQLAKLPALSSLRLLGGTEHVLGVALLTHLTQIEWGFDAGQVEDVDALITRFAATAAPPNLQRARIHFEGSIGAPVEDAHVHPFARLADAVIAWCVHAPALHTVAWDVLCDMEECAGLTDVRLCALAANPSMRLITFDGGDYQGNLPRMQHLFRQKIGCELEVL